MGGSYSMGVLIPYKVSKSKTPGSYHDQNPSQRCLSRKPSMKLDVISLSGGSDHRLLSWLQYQAPLKLAKARSPKVVLC